MIDNMVLDRIKNAFSSDNDTIPGTEVEGDGGLPKKSKIEEEGEEREKNIDEKMEKLDEKLKKLEKKEKLEEKQKKLEELRQKHEGAEGALGALSSLLDSAAPKVDGGEPEPPFADNGEPDPFLETFRAGGPNGEDKFFDSLEEKPAEKRNGKNDFASMFEPDWDETEQGEDLMDVVKR